MNEIEELRDSMRRNAKSPLARTTLTREINGAHLTLQVSPCAWMYNNHHLQVQIIMAGGGVAYIHDKETRFDNATEADLQRLFDRVKIVTCKRCGKPAFDPQSMETNRDGLCETCFMADFKKEFEADMARINEQIAADDVKYRAQGYTHRVNAWIHPREGGDDRPVHIWYRGQPAHATVAAKLRELGSGEVNDYDITPIS